MATTYTLIDKAILGSAQSSVEFTSVSSDYTDLMVLLSLRASNAANFDIANLRFNNDTSNNYTSNTNIYGYNGSAYSGASSTKDVINIGYINADSSTANTFANQAIYIPNYKTTDRKKSVSVDSVQEINSANDAVMWLSTSYWNTSNAAITNLQFTINSGATFKAGSSFYLYGIKNS